MNGDEYPVDAIWIAELNGFKFMADNPIELLGLVAIYDHKKPESDSNYWWHVEGEDIWTELMEDAFPDSE
ncbi:hypothetical protein V8J88_23875 [Massilia sp. W12]|uniref:hypothetical protein n=1 Tax=Massilia sp. W12 TaxID=3126507 RepID=UPI0030D33CDF